MVAVNCRPAILISCIAKIFDKVKNGRLVSVTKKSVRDTIIKLNGSTNVMSLYEAETSR